VGKLDLDLQLVPANAERRILRQRPLAREPLAVDERAVARAEIFDLDALGHRPDHRMSPRDLRVWDLDVGIRPPDDEIAIDVTDIVCGWPS